VEIVCASVFVQRALNTPRERAPVPESKERGFALVVRFLKEWDWKEPLIVPLYEEEGEVASTGQSATSPASGVWRLATEMDRAGQMWTKEGPDVLIAQRIRDLAKATWKVLQSIERGTREFQVTFTLLRTSSNSLTWFKDNICAFLG